MTNSKKIKDFYFVKAQYQVGDGNGNSALLTVDYKDNTFRIESTEKTHNLKFASHVKEVGRDLLKRKHGVNFADRV